MPSFVTLTCPSCERRLEIANDIDRFACAHCGTEYIVRREGGVVSLTPAVIDTGQVQTGIGGIPPVLILPRERPIRTEPLGLPEPMTPPTSSDQESSQSSGGFGILVLIALIVIVIWFLSTYGFPGQ